MYYTINANNGKHLERMSTIEDVIISLECMRDNPNLFHDIRIITHEGEREFLLEENMIID